MIGFLHTADVHTATFNELVDAIGSPETERHAIVDAQLLADAQDHGVNDPRIVKRMKQHLADLAAHGVTTAICTCSTIGCEAERLGAEMGLPTMRVDRAMAHAAIAAGSRIAVIATAESTLTPTRQLVEAVAADAGVSVDLQMHLCAEAWPKFLAGDQAGYLASVADMCRSVGSNQAQPVDVIILAQASMMAATGDLSMSVPVLTSPPLAVAAAVAQEQDLGH